MLYCNSLDETSKIRTYVGSDGKLHFVNKAGADSVLNFSSDGNSNLECIYHTGTGNIQGHNNRNTIGGLTKNPKVLLIGFYYSSTIYLTATIITSLNASLCTGRDGDTQFVCSPNGPVKLVSYNDNSISYTMNWGLYPTNAAIYVYG